MRKFSYLIKFDSKKSEKRKLDGNDQDKKIRRKQDNLQQHIFTKNIVLSKMPCRNTEVGEKTLLNFIFRGPNTSKERTNIYALSVI